MARARRLYVKLPYLGALYCEFSILNKSEYLLSINKFGKELIINLPWVEIILTPWSVLKREAPLLEDKPHVRRKTASPHQASGTNSTITGVIKSFPLHRS